MFRIALDIDHLAVLGGDDHAAADRAVGADGGARLQSLGAQLRRIGAGLRRFAGQCHGAGRQAGTFEKLSP